MKKTGILYLFLFVFIVFNLIFSCTKHKITSTIEAENNNSIQYNDKNIYFAYRDISEAKKERNPKLLSEIYLNLGVYYLEKNKSDSSFYYFNRSKEEAFILNDSVTIGKSLLNMAIIQGNEGDYYGCEETAVDAIKYFNPAKDQRYMAPLYNCLAIAKNGQKNYLEAIDYYNRSLLFSTDKLSTAPIKNNQAIAYANSKNYTQAIQILNSLIKDDSLKFLPKSYATITDNLAYIKWLKDKQYNAEAILLSTLKIREKENDYLGQIANRSHLTDYYSIQSPQKAIFHANEMYRLSNSYGTPEDRLEALRKIILLSNDKGTKDRISKYLHINDSIQAVKNRAKNQFALIRYEVEKSKEENLKLKAENSEKEYQILKQQVSVFIIIILTTIGVIIVIFWIRKRKQQFIREKKEIVHLTELKYSRKIHDEVANSIYYLMVQMEHNNSLSKSKIIDNLEDLYHKSRNISHESEFRSDLKNDFPRALREIMDPYGGKSRKIIIIGNEEKTWENVSANKKEEIYYVINEFMTNMNKHSRASLITLKIIRTEDQINIDYFDNGIGFSNQQSKSGKGLKNIETRINSINGNITFNSIENKGLFIKINLKV